MAPFLGSWDGRTTSRRTPPVIGRREESDEGAGSTSVSADFFVEEEIEAEGAMRDRGTVVDAGIGLVMLVVAGGDRGCTSQRSRRHCPREGHHLG